MDLAEAFQLFSHFVFADKGHYFNKTMQYETIDKAIQTNARVLGTPVFIRCPNTLIANWKIKFLYEEIWWLTWSPLSLRKLPAFCMLE